MDTTLSEPNDAELEWIARYVSIARRSTADPDADELDALWADWLEDGRAEDANEMVHVVGLAFGQLLVDDLGMHWVVASDDLGSEIAIHHPAGDILVYPANLVAKRWESRGTAFLRPIYDDLRARLQ